jgi:cytochrome c556
VKPQAKILGLGLILVAGIALAKEGVTNPVVKERMDLMQVVRVSTGTLGDMASGKVPFDATKAAEAQAALAAAAAAIPAGFEPQETDPVSEARPEIWANFADFTAKAKSLEEAALAIDTTSVEGVRAGMGAVGGACKACHTDYRM